MSYTESLREGRGEAEVLQSHERLRPSYRMDEMPQESSFSGCIVSRFNKVTQTGDIHRSPPNLQFRLDSLSLYKA